MDELNQPNEDESSIEDELETLDEETLADDEEIIEIEEQETDILNIDLDIEAALASVSSLSDVIAEQEAQEVAERTRQEETQRKYEEQEAQRAAYYLPRPSMHTLQRGQMGSVIPALMLILLGAGLTFALSSEDTTLSGGMIALITMGAFGVLLIAQWLSSGRWSRGALFGGLSLIFVTGGLYFLANNDPGADGYPLLLSAIGVAAVLSGILAPVMSKYQFFVGVASIIAGVVSYSVNISDADLQSLNPGLLIGVVVAIAVLYIAPLAMRRRG